MPKNALFWEYIQKLPGRPPFIFND